MDATYLTTLSLVVSFLGGGIIGALVNYVRAERSEKRERQIKFLDEQIRNLYGPLYYWVSQIERLFEINKRFLDAYDAEFVREKWAKDPATQESVRAKSGLTIDLANKYIAEVEDKNLEIRKILDSQYSHIDPDDIELFLLFYEHDVRKKVEIGEDGKLKTPGMIYYEVGQIAFIRPEFIARVKEKFLGKKSQLDGLIHGQSVKEWLKSLF